MTPQPSAASETPDSGYYTLTELRARPIEALNALWENVPTERQAFYRAAYDAQVRAASAQHSDKSEWQVIQDLIARYDNSATVPMNEGYWTNVPANVREAVQTNLPLAGHDIDHSRARTTADKARSPLMLAGGAAIAALLLLTALPNLLSSGTHPGAANKPTP